MHKFLTLSLVSAALIGAGGIAYAQAGAAPERAPLSRAEVEQRSAEAFARMDANDDGKLDRTDRAARREVRFARLDANDDGALDEADRAARQKDRFARIDTDRDGALSFEEFSAVREARAERRGARAERRGPGRGGPRMVRAADTNRDGTVTQAEFASAALARFDRIDVDKDGTIGADERPAPRRPMRRERRLRDAG